MEKYWKIKNVTEAPIKFTVALSSTLSPGIVLQPNQYCIALPKITSMLDIQEKRGFVSVDRNFENTQSLELGKVFDTTSIDETDEQIKNYKNS